MPKIAEGKQAMKNFALVNSDRGVVHVYGTLPGEDAEEAATSINSNVEGPVRGRPPGTRYTLKESNFRSYDLWFLVELQSVTSRPQKMDDSS